jgi:hypothetical protein
LTDYTGVNFGRADDKEFASVWNEAVLSSSGASMQFLFIFFIPDLNLLLICGGMQRSLQMND